MANEVYAVTFRKVSYATVFVQVDEYADYTDYADYVQMAQSIVRNDPNEVHWSEAGTPIVVSNELVSD